MKILQFLIILFCFNNAWASVAKQDEIIVKSVNAGIKLSFHSNAIVDFTLNQSNQQLEVIFNQPFKPKLHKLLNNNIVKTASLTNHNSLVLGLKDSNVKVTKFISDNFAGINIVSNNQASVSKASAHVVGNISSDFGFVVEASENSAGKMMVFPWQKNVAASVFYREGYLWIIFNENQLINLNNVKSVFKKDVSEFSIIPNNSLSIMRFKGDNLKNIKTYKQGFNWVVQVLNDPSQAVPATPIVQYKTPYSKGIFFPVEDIIQEPISLIDPVIGDDLKVVLCYGGDVGVPKTRNFINFSVLHSAQGFVLQPLADQVKLKIIIPGIEIISSESNMSNSVLRTDDKSDDRDHVYSCLPFDKWNGLSLEDAAKADKQMRKDIRDAKDGDKNRLRFELAKFLLGAGFVNEAQGMLNYINMLDPSFLQNNQGMFISGVVEFMLKHYDEAQSSFSKVNSAVMKEEDRLEFYFWQGALALVNKKDSVDYDFIRFKDRFLKTYPKKIYYQLAYLDLESSINSGNLDHADDIFKTIRVKDSDAQAMYKYENSNLYYFSQYLIKNNNDISVAVKILDAIKQDARDPFNRARAEFLNTKILYEAKRMKILDAIDALNKARFIWRGDRLEYQIDDYLSNLYLDQKDYIDTLRLWKLIASKFTDQINVLEFSAKMSQLFFHIFGPDGAVNEMDDLKAIALFYEFRELTPIGKMGDRIVQTLVDKLVNLDLLAKASELLSHQVNFRLTGVDRIMAASKLANIYILNRQPEKALDTLDNTQGDNIPDALKSQRNLLRARSLFDLDQRDLALSTLGNDKSDGAGYIRSDIYWSEADWPGVVSVLSPLLNKKLASGKLNKVDSSYFLELILAYVRENDVSSAQNLYNQSIDKIDISDGGKIKNILDFIAKADPTIDYRNLESSIGVDNMKQFLSQYRQDLSVPAM